MRGGGGRPSSSVSRQRRMPQRKQQGKDGSQDGDTLETNDEMSSTLPEPVTSRDRRRRERENRTRTTDMTEEQMMDLALQLSEQEANISALRLQKEEEAVVKAIQESMFSQTQACPPSVQICSGHNGTSQEPEAPGAVAGQERDRKPETLGLSHTQRIDCELNEDSQQSSDSLQDASLLSRSPVFPSTGRRAEVLVPRLTQDVLDSCRSSGFVHCSQDGWTSPQSPGEDASSGTFRSSPVFSETGREDAGTSPALDLNTRRPGFCRTQDGTSGFTAVSQETVPSSTRSTSCRTQSPVFPRSPRLDEAESIRSPEVDREQRAGPAEDRTRGPQRTRLEQQRRMDVQTGLGPDVDSSEDPDQDQELSSHMTLRWSSEDEDATLVATPSPVFSEERPLPQADHVTHSHVTSACPEPTQLDQSRQRQSPGCSGSRRSASSGSVSRTPSTVHYYWGVPFCPRGLDPDHYTQVIVAQMEVYEKTLKQAQRGLLRKAEWGEAVLPQPKKSPSSESRTESPQQLLPPRRGLRLRGTRQSEDADVCPAEEEEGEKEEKEEEPEEQVDTDCEVCPETQLIDSDDDRTQDLTERMETSEKMEEDNMDTELEQPEDTGSVRDELQDEDVDVDTTSRGHDGSPVKEDDQECPDVEDITERELQRSTSPELELTTVPQVPEGTVDCPICQGSFPVARIVMHAAFCDGELATVDETRTADDRSHVSLKLRRKRTRRGDMEDTAETSTARNQETCFICCRSVPQRLYSRHTELCLRQQRASERPKQNLLLALDRSDHTDSDVGPSGSNLQTREVIDLRDDDDEEDEGGVTAAGTGNSRPIRTFTPISEATDCLVDFSKQQRPKKVGQRRR